MQFTANGMDISDIELNKQYGSSDAAKILGCTRQNICLQASLGRIEHVRLGNGSYVFSGRAILDYLQAKSLRNTSRRRAMTLSEPEAV